jgi:hypothetical protein
MSFTETVPDRINVAGYGGVTELAVKYALAPSCHAWAGPAPPISSAHAAVPVLHVVEGPVQ